jgi:hypothetical protein
MIERERWELRDLFESPLMCCLMCSLHTFCLHFILHVSLDLSSHAPFLTQNERLLMVVTEVRS